LQCIGSSSKFIKKKAILSSIKLLKKAPQFLSDYMPAVVDSLDDKNHGVLLGCFAFLENALIIDESKTEGIIALMPKVSQIYRQIVSDFNSEYEIGGVQDPFLQVAILRFLRFLRKYTSSANFMKYYGEILVTSHDGVCAKTSSGNVKNAANAILFECFQCFMTIPLNPTLSTYTENVLTKFVSVKDANSKYLSLFNLGLMAKHDINVARRYKGTIVECLEENDILIRIMALDLLYLIATPENVSSIIKELLNVLLSATDEEFIAELSLKVLFVLILDLPHCGEVLAEQEVALRHYSQSAHPGRPVREGGLGQVAGAPHCHHSRTAAVLPRQAILLRLPEPQERHTLQSDHVPAGRVLKCADPSARGGDQGSERD
jgi:AP-1 complex subunit gamma-1